MARKGRYREIVVSQIEKLLSNNDNLEIITPAFLEDKVTKQKREVDILIKGKIGYHELLIGIECRQRKHKDDTRWIEELGNKKNDIGIDKIIAVSSSDFTEPAKLKAKHYNIDLRLLKDVGSDSISDWINNIIFEHFELNFEFLEVDLGFLKNEYDGVINPEIIKSPVETGRSSVNMNDKVLTFKEMDKFSQYFSFNDLIFNINQSSNNAIYDDVIPNNDKKLKRINFYFYDNKQLLYMDYNNKQYRIIYLFTSGYYWIKTEIIPIRNTVQYFHNDSLLAERIDYIINLNNKDLVLAVQNDVEKKQQNAIVFIKE